IALLMFMHAFATGITRLSQKSGQPDNVICLSDGATDELYSNLPTNETSNLARQEGVVQTGDGRPLCSREVYVFTNQVMPAPAGDRPKYRFFQIRGVEEPDVSAQVHGLVLVGGSSVSDTGVRPGWPADKTAEGASPYPLVEAVVGEGLARELGNDRGKASLEAGDVLTIGPRDWVVVGIMRGAEATFGSEVWAKPQQVGEIF